MNSGRSALQCEHVNRSADPGANDRSSSHALHLKCIIGVMKPLLVVFLIATSISAYGQSIADIARRERARQAKSQATRIITQTQATKVEPANTTPPAGGEKPKPVEAAKPAATPVDPVQAWNAQLDQLRVKIRALQDQEMALLLQQNQVTNQVYAPVTDPATQQKSLAQLGEIQGRVAALRKELEDARRSLDALQLQGPAKK
jgi:hypothetical protein